MSTEPWDAAHNPFKSIDLVEPIHIVNGYLWKKIKEQIKAAVVYEAMPRTPRNDYTYDPTYVGEKVHTNRYWEKVKGKDEYDVYGGRIPIFPVNDSTSGDAKWINKPYFVYTQAFRVSHGFHEIKKATFVYSLKASIDDYLGWSAAVLDVLDRQDDAAADINEYNWGLKATDPTKYCPVIFHSLRVYQNEPAKPSGAVSTPAVTTHFMVVVEYHLTQKRWYTSNEETPHI